MSSCVALSAGVAKSNHLSSRMVSRIFRFAAIKPAVIDISPDFDPAMSFQAPTIMFTNLTDSSESECAAAWPGAQGLSGMDGQTALMSGLANLDETLTSDLREIRAVRSEIRASAESGRMEWARLRKAMYDFSPRVTTYRVVEDRGRMVPTILMEAANAVGRPIDAFLLTVTLQSPDGKEVGQGRVRFNVPLPLGPGQEGSYVLNLAGVAGIDTPAVLGFVGAIRASVTLDDIIAEGHPVLGRYLTGPMDHRRTIALETYEADVFHVKSLVDSMRRHVVLQQ